MVKDKETAVEDSDARRDFVIRRDGKDLKFYLGMPGAEEIRKADWHYSKVYNRALIDGVATQAEMLDILTKRGLYGPEYHEHTQVLQDDVAQKIIDMEIAELASDRRNLALEVARARDELFQWNQRLNGPLSNTCEQMADDAKTEYLTSIVVQKEDGSRVWDGWESFLHENDQGLAMKSRLEVLLWLQGLESDFFDKTPERIVLNELARAEATPKLAPVKEDADKIEEVAAEVVVSKPKKTRGKNVRSKKTSKKKGA